MSLIIFLQETLVDYGAFAAIGEAYQEEEGTPGCAACEGIDWLDHIMGCPRFVK